MDKPAEGGTPGQRGRPKAASSRQQIASTPKRTAAQPERRLRAQSFTAAATPGSDTAAQEAVRESLTLQPQQAVGSQQTAAGGDSGGPNAQPSVAPTAAAAAAGTGPAATQDQESPITSRQRRAPGAAAARAAGGAAAKTAGKVPAHHDRRGHVPPADHHAEAQTGALLPPPEAADPAEQPAAAQPAAADSEAPARGPPEAASGETRDAPAAARGGGRKGGSVTEGSDGSDERRDAPTAAAGVHQSHPQQPQPPPKGAAGAKVAGSLFSPVFSLFGGKPASDVPPQPGDEEAGVRSTGDEGHERRPADVSARSPSGGVKGDSSADAEATGAVRAADDDVHSENDTQIRVPSGQSSGSQARRCSSTEIIWHGHSPHAQRGLGLTALNLCCRAAQAVLMRMDMAVIFDLV